MTINQALDKILTKYKSADMAKYPDVQALRQNLIELKVLIGVGGNTPVDNPEYIKQVIKTGYAPK